MDIKGFLHNIFSSIGQSPALQNSEGKPSVLGQAISGAFKPDQSVISPIARNQPTPTPTPAQQYDPQALGQVIQQGFQNYGSPAATQSAPFAQAGNQLRQQYPQIDPLLVAILSLKETSGGKRLAPNSANNYLNIGPNINYPDVKTNVMGGGTWGSNGGPQRGFMGVMKQPIYKQYLKTGNLQDFFNTYTPQGAGNASSSSQVNQYNTLREQFLQNISPDLLKKAGIN